MVLTLVNICLLTTIVLALARLFRGPSWADRLIALDFLGSSLTILFVVIALQTGFAALLDTALLLSVLGFLTSFALARYVLEKRVIRP